MKTKEEILERVSNIERMSANMEDSYVLKRVALRAMQEYADQLQPSEVVPSDSGLLTFEQCLLEEFLFNTQNYPEEYHNLFKQKFNRASLRFKSHLKAAE